MIRRLVSRGAAALPVALLIAPLAAQIRVPGTPAARSFALPQDVPTVAVPVPDVDAYRLEDQWREENGVPGPLRFGVPIAVDVEPSSAGRWDATSDGQIVWRVRFESPGAKSLGLEFSMYRLPEGGQLFVYDDELDEVYGAFDHTQNNLEGPFGVSPFPGDALIVEYKQPAELGAVADLHIERVVYDYRDFFELERELDRAELELHSGGGGVTGGCNVGANCPNFDAWPLQKRCAVRTVYGGGLCSASLINNTANDGTQYVLAANHCGQNTSTVFRFRYIQSGCETGSAPVNDVSGASVMATHSTTDGRLLRINPAIPSSYNEYWNGWSRSTSSPTFGLSYHFPGGAAMCGAIDSNGGGPITPSFQGIGPIPCWNINSQVGGTIGGSSGSPLFDQNLRTIGSLTGGPASCFTSYYARFYNFWNAVNLAQWLDPLATGQTTLNGFDPFAAPCSAPTTYGAGELGSTGTLAVIGSSGGLPSVTNPGFTITLVGGVPNQTSILFEGPQQDSIPTVWGTLLVGNSIRYPSVTSATGTDSHVVTMSPGMAGTTLFYQWLVRDPGFGGGAQHSGGLAVTFCP